MKVFVLVILLQSCINGNQEQNEGLKINYKYLSKVLQRKDYHTWGASPIIDDSGRIHLYVSQWPIPEKGSDEGFHGWFKHCEISHYVSDSISGPYQYVDTPIKDLDGLFNSPHNPTIKKIDGKYVLCFIVNENDDRRFQRIVMYVSDDLNDEWKPASFGEEDGTILRVPKDQSIWNYKAVLGVSNPSLIKHKDVYYLYFKSIISDIDDPENFDKWNFSYGVAISKNLEGPYKIHPKPVTNPKIQLEDVYAFVLNDKVNLISRDFRGSLGSRGGGLHWISNNPLHFSRKSVSRSFEDLSFYLADSIMNDMVVYRGKKEGHLERPQLLFLEDQPNYIFLATGINNDDGYGSAVHLFKINRH